MGVSQSPVLLALALGSALCAQGSPPPDSLRVCLVLPSLVKNDSSVTRGVARQYEFLSGFAAAMDSVATLTKRPVAVYVRTKAAAQADIVVEPYTGREALYVEQPEHSWSMPIEPPASAHLEACLRYALLQGVDRLIIIRKTTKVAKDMSSAMATVALRYDVPTTEWVSDYTKPGFLPPELSAALPGKAAVFIATVDKGYIAQALQSIVEAGKAPRTVVIGLPVWPRFDLPADALEACHAIISDFEQASASERRSPWLNTYLENHVGATMPATEATHLGYNCGRYVLAVANAGFKPVTSFDKGGLYAFQLRVDPTQPVIGSFLNMAVGVFSYKEGDYLKVTE